MGAAVSVLGLAEVEQFVYREARYADEHDYDAWEALWTDDALYWVPAGDDGDPETHMSVLYDNRARIATRLNQLRTGKRFSQTPPSSLRRLVSNVEVLGTDGADTVAGANFLLVESRERRMQIWAGRTTYRLRPVGGDIRMAYKKVMLVNRDAPLANMAFLI